MSVCKIDGCDGKVEALGLCNKHYLRLRNNGNTNDNSRTHASLKDRFMRKVHKTEYCWQWIGNKRPNGYGSIQEGGKGSKTLSAHRVSYTLFIGEIPDGMVVMHKCDNPSCVNPDHLQIGTYKDNTQDMINKGRKKVKFVVGEKVYGAVLNSEKVKEIRSLLPHHTNRYIAELYGVGINTIRSIRIGKTWSHVI